MPLLPRQRCPAKTVPVWRSYPTWRDEVREGYALPSVSTFSTEGSALRLPVALPAYPDVLCTEALTSATLSCLKLFSARLSPPLSLLTFLENVGSLYGNPFHFLQVTEVP